MDIKDGIILRYAQLARESRPEWVRVELDGRSSVPITADGCVFCWIVDHLQGSSSGRRKSLLSQGTVEIQFFLEKIETLFSLGIIKTQL